MVKKSTKTVQKDVKHHFWHLHAASAALRATLLKKNQIALFFSIALFRDLAFFLEAGAQRLASGAEVSEMMFNVLLDGSPKFFHHLLVFYTFFYHITIFFLRLSWISQKQRKTCKIDVFSL